MYVIQSIRSCVLAAGVLMLTACASSPPSANDKPAAPGHKQQVVELLKSIENGDSKPIAYINPDKYIQHNRAVGEGLAGVKTLLQSMPKGSTRVNTVRVFEDG